MQARQRPDNAAISDSGLELKFHHPWRAVVSPLEVFKWARGHLAVIGGRAAARVSARLVHGHAGAGHFGIAKMLHHLREQFYWPNCHMDTELFVHPVIRRATFSSLTELWQLAVLTSHGAVGLQNRMCRSQHNSALLHFCSGTSSIPCALSVQSTTGTWTAAKTRYGILLSPAQETVSCAWIRKGDNGGCWDEAVPR